VTRDLLETMDRDATLVIDSFTLSGWLSQWFAARFPGQIVDAGPLAPVGHGIGMGIGVQLARPGKQVIVVIGDGGFGIGGMELETGPQASACRSSTLLWNNSSWGPGFEQMPMLRGRVDPFDMLPELRYDRMFEAIGCHGEHVTQPDELRPALERAFAAGKPSVDQRHRGSARRACATRREPARVDEGLTTEDGVRAVAVPGSGVPLREQGPRGPDPFRARWDLWTDTRPTSRSGTPDPGVLTVRRPSVLADLHERVRRP
jgi:hypothetical protein